MKLLKQYIEAHTEIYLYGSGINAKLLLKVLKRMKHIPKGFLVSENGPYAAIDGIPVLAWENAKNNISPSAGIILAVREEWQPEILPNLTDRDVLILKDEEFCFLKGRSFKETLAKLQSEVAPPQKIPISQWRNILVIRIDAVGDMVWTTPFLRELRRNVSADAKITLLHNVRTSSLLAGCPYIDKSIPIDVPLRTWDFEPDIERIKQRLREFCRKSFEGVKFDTVILPRFIMHGDCIDAFLIALYSGATNRLIRQNNYEPHTDIYQKELNALCSDVYTTTEPKHEVECMMDFLRYLGMNVVNDALELWAKNESPQCLHFASGTIYVAVGLVASTKKRSWHPLNYAALFQRLEKIYQGVIVFVLLGGKETFGAHDILADEGVYKRCCIDLIGKTTLHEVCSVIRHCSFYLGSNTGLLHVAAACGKPTVVLDPYSEISEIHELSHVRCASWKVREEWLTPEQMDSGKINKISVEQVYSSMIKIIKEIL